MQKIICDACGKEAKVLTLHEWYQVGDIKEVCEECEGKLDKIIYMTDRLVADLRKERVKNILLKIKGDRK